MKLLADTSALLALLLREDENHAAASRFARESSGGRGARLVMTDLIVAELATRLRARAGAARAVAVTREILLNPRCELYFLDSALLDGAIARMERYADKRLSLADCASFELIDHLGLDAAFTFDADFRACGFDTVP